MTLIDIDRLHYVVDNRDIKELPRRCGKTRSRCHDVAGFIGLEFRIIFVIMAQYNNLEYLIPMLHDVLEEHDFNVIHVDRCTIQSMNSTIKFITERDIYKMNGSDRCAVVMTQYD